MDTQQQILFNVLLIGDTCTDRYNIGSVDRLSPEAPVPVLKIVDTYDVPGMASNVNLNLINLNISADFVTNNDPITKTRFIDERSGQHLLRVDDEPKITGWSGDIPFPLEHYDAIVVSDYNKGFLTYEHIQNLIHDFNGPVFIDTKKKNLEAFNGAYVKINEKEFEAAESYAWDMIVTLGANGAMLRSELVSANYATKKVDVVDVCGAGDTFLAALTYQYLVTNSIEEAIKFANKASSITVQHVGNYAPTLGEIE